MVLYETVTGFNSDVNVSAVGLCWFMLNLFISGISQTYVECICPSGYVGSGVGPAGCVRSSGTVNSCDQMHCVNGNCLTNSAGAPVCMCYHGYTGMSL